MFGCRCCCRRSKINIVSEDSEELVRLKDEPRLEWFGTTPSFLEAVKNIKMKHKDIHAVDVKKSIVSAFVDLLMWRPERITHDDIVYSIVYRAFKPAVQKHLSHMRGELADMGEQLIYRWLTNSGRMIEDIVEVFNRK